MYCIALEVNLSILHSIINTVDCPATSQGTGGHFVPSEDLPMSSRIRIALQPFRNIVLGVVSSFSHGDNTALEIDNHWSLWLEFISATKWFYYFDILFGGLNTEIAIT